MQRLNEQELLAEARSGAVILTANKRSALFLRRRFDDLQRSQHEVWDSPSILTFSAWLKSLWNEALLRSAAAPIVLSSSQELVIWEQIISLRRERSGPLQLRATASMAANAWRLLHQYKLPFDRNRFSSKIDSEAFFNWAAEYVRRTAERRWTDEARLPGLLAQRLAGIPLPRRILLHGFDRLTPQQQDFLASLGVAGVVSESVEVSTENESAVRTSLNDAGAECVAAANWARQRLDESPTHSIGIIVPRMEDLRGTLERALLDALHPHALSITCVDTRRAFEFSLGRPLSRTPIIGAALRLLRFAFEPLPIEDVGRLLRSPFLKGSAIEAGPRALLDAEIRRRGQRDYTVAGLVDAAGNIRNKAAACPLLRAQLENSSRSIRNLPERLPASEWSERIPKILAAISWPGDRAPNSTEHQAIDAWVELLGDFAHLDAVEPWIARAEVANRVAQLAEEKTFQPQNTGAPIQVLGLLEAAGSSFDHLWAMGLHEDAWPPDAEPNPFLPLALQRQSGVPAASAATQFEFAERVTTRLLRSARHIIFSYPRTDGDSELRASSLLRNLAACEVSEIVRDPAQTWVSAIHASGQSPSAIERRPDTNGPALTEAAHGGTRIFQLQAACPFRAFSELRLGARELESPQPGIDPRERGGVLHKALEKIWRTLKSQEQLRKMPDSEREELVRSSVVAALAEKKIAVGSAWEIEIANVERDRLMALLHSYLKFEEQRARPFTVIATEQKKEVVIGNVTLNVMVDRIDEIDGVGRIVLDYKSTAPNLGVWKDERPDEPQLPIYATKATEHSVAGVAFAQVRNGDICFKGVTEIDGVLPGVKPAIGKGEGKVAFAELLANWNIALDKLAGEFASGLATVNPKDRNDTCRNCAIKSLCRIAEHQAAAFDHEEERDGD